ncbi:Nodulation protein nolO [Actinokineospora spheciospongiae]|uniref:Nodulation protein nolO n=1 Tax=Actinokineospora spheciospongiae TaxID=909613 RepID=W7IQA2_9PSEU|nr:carbamoyltransferase C-terminal domain-containing protein [Actinokineospora spheciospongiae]EWC58701.1 Nodulation protein nolO [Actinokineospora spheciospongiae]
MYVLGISRVHDSAAALVRDGEITAFAEEERFTRVKHDGGFPTEAIRFCLDRAGITLADVDHVAYYWQRWKEPIHAAKVFARYFPGTLAVFRNETGDAHKAASMVDTLRTGGGKGPDDYHVGGAVLAHVKRSYTLGRDVREALGFTGETKFKVHLIDHHRSHAASAYYISPFDESAVLTFDGIGSDGTSTLFAHGRGDRMVDLRRIKFPHSLGAMYAGVTGYLGFYPTMDEGKVMGLAPFGRDTYVEQFKDLVHLDPDGGFELNLEWFRHHTTGKHLMSQKFTDTFGPARERTKVSAANPVPQHYMDIAYALQVTLEEAGLHIARWLQRETGSKRLCVAGGVALNSVMNGRLLLETDFEEFFAQPAAADDGCAVGAALEVTVGKHRLPRPRTGYTYTGPDYTEAEMELALQDAGVEYTRVDDIAAHTAARIADGMIVGWVQGRMECGPRALGNRSLVADPRLAESKERMNEKVKHREPFRPFAPSCLAEKAGEWFASGYPSPVMLLVFDVLEHQRAAVPAITHVDGTARVQTVSETDNPLYWRMISEFEKLTGVPMVVNTSFNDNNEPIVASPADAIACYLKTDVDALALGPFWVEKQRMETE